MKGFKTQMRRITERFIALTVVICSVMLLTSGFAVSKINTEYMETGIRAAKIVAQRENEEIFVSMNGRKFAAPKHLSEYLEAAVLFLPAPLNAVYYLCERIYTLIK